MAVLRVAGRPSSGVGGGPFEWRVCLGLLLQHGLGRQNDREPLLLARQLSGQFISSPGLAMALR